MKKLTLSIAAVLSLGVSTVAVADKTAFNDGESAVNYRHSAFHIIRDNFAAMAAMVKGEEEYDADIFQQRAEDFARMTHIPWSAFSVEGAMPGEDTDALPEIWDNWDDFKQRSESFIADGEALADAARSGSMDNIKPAFMAAAKNCKGCHDNYKD